MEILAKHKNPLTAQCAPTTHMSSIFPIKHYNLVLVLIACPTASLRASLSAIVLYILLSINLLSNTTIISSQKSQLFLIQVFIMFQTKGFI